MSYREFGFDKLSLVEFVGHVGTCDWCGREFTLALHNMICDSHGDWQLDCCDDCRAADVPENVNLVKEIQSTPLGEDEEPF